jgi:hypothetical protein
MLMKSRVLTLMKHVLTPMTCGVLMPMMCRVQCLEVH